VLRNSCGDPAAVLGDAAVKHLKRFYPASAAEGNRVAWPIAQAEMRDGTGLSIVLVNAGFGGSEIPEAPNSVR